jgi:hypothetical protein
VHPQIEKRIVERPFILHQAISAGILLEGKPFQCLGELLLAFYLARANVGNSTSEVHANPIQMGCHARIIRFKQVRSYE